MTGQVSLAASDKVNCLINCLIMETGTSLLSEFAPILGKIGTIADCTAFLANPSDSEALASCAAGIQTSIPGAGTIVSAVNCYNRSLANPDYCKCTSSLWEGTTMPIAKTEACKKTPCVNGVYAPYATAVYPCAACTKCMAGSGGSDNPADHCKPTGATPPSECRKTTSIAVRASGPLGQDDDIFDGMKICMLIPRDPNAKYGPEGELVPGQELTYRITYENEGLGRAYGVYITDELDANLDDSTLVIGSNARYIPATRTVIWSIGELGPKGAADSKGEVTFTIHLKNGIPGGTPVFNRAVVYFPSAPEMTPTNAVVNYVQYITVLPQNLETNYMTPLNITLQGMDVGGAPLTFTVVQQPLFGTLSGVAPNLVYTPGANMTGQDKFTYQASNGSSTSEPAEVTIIIHPAANDATPPHILWTLPGNNAAGVPYRASPVFTDATGAVYAPFPIIQFSEALNINTVTVQNLTITDSSGHSLALSVLYNELGNQVILYPHEFFKVNTWYTVRVKGSITDQMGNPLGSDVVFSFQIGKAFDLTYLYIPVVHK